MIHRVISGLSRTCSCDLRWIPKLGMHYPSIRTNNTEEDSTRHELCDRSCCLLSYNTFILRSCVLPRPRTTRHKYRLRLHLHLRPGAVTHISSTTLQHLFNISSTSLQHLSNISSASLQHLFNISTPTHQQNPPSHPALPTKCPTTASDSPQLPLVQREIAPSTQSWNSCATQSPTCRTRLLPSRIQSCSMNL